jgi:hypothetical protein
MEKYLYWSFHTGQMFDVVDDEVPTLDAFQVRLKQLPNKNCNRCYGRFYEGKNANTGLYIPCQKCRKKCIDYETLIGDIEKQVSIG